jgi:kynurenine formamidase
MPTARSPRRVARTGALVAAAAGLFLAGNAVGAGTATGSDNSKVIRYREVVFLSHVNTTSMPIFPGDPIPVITDTYTVVPDGFKLQTATIADHSGTHWGAPCHFNDGEKCAEAMEANDFVRRAAVIDIRSKVDADPDYALSIDDVKRYEKRYGKIPADAIVIAYTGWQERWADPVAYFNEDADQVMHYPGISAEATQWLIDRRDIGGLGIDTHGVDPGADTSFLTNTLLLADDRIHLENLAGLEQMPAKGGWVMVGGVRNLGGSGSPATVLGFVP